MAIFLYLFFCFITVAATINSMCSRIYFLGFLPQYLIVISCALFSTRMFCKVQNMSFLPISSLRIFVQYLMYDTKSPRLLIFSSFRFQGIIPSLLAFYHLCALCTYLCVCKCMCTCACMYESVSVVCERERCHSSGVLTLFYLFF